MASPHPYLIALASGRVLAPVQDGGAIVESAVEHRMTGLLWDRVSAEGVDLGEEPMQRLAKADMATTMHHLDLWNAVESLTGRLEGAGVPTVVFKGVIDEQRWFSRIGNRPCSDVDILVKDLAHVDRALEVLAPDHRARPHLSELIESGHILSLDLFVDEIHVDLHFDAVKVGRGWRDRELWLAHTTTIRSPSGTRIEVLDDEAAAALRLIHLGKDYLRYLIGVVEAGRIISSDLDWQEVSRLIDSERLNEAVGVLCEVVVTTLGIPAAIPAADGWRASLWRREWSTKNALRGGLFHRRLVRRSRWMFSVTRPGMALSTLAWLVRSAFPPKTLLDLGPRGSGPYLLRLIGMHAERISRYRK